METSRKKSQESTKVAVDEWNTNKFKNAGDDELERLNREFGRMELELDESK